MVRPSSTSATSSRSATPCPSRCSTLPAWPASPRCASRPTPSCSPTSARPTASTPTPARPGRRIGTRRPHLAARRSPARQPQNFADAVTGQPPLECGPKRNDVRNQRCASSGDRRRRHVQRATSQASRTAAIASFTLLRPPASRNAGGVTSITTVPTYPVAASRLRNRRHGASPCRGTR